MTSFIVLALGFLGGFGVTIGVHHRYMNNINLKLIDILNSGRYPTTQEFCDMTKPKAWWRM